MDTANTHDDTIDEATQPFEQGTTADASVEKQHPEAPDDGSTTPPTSGRPLPPHHPRWSDRLTTPAAGWVATAIATILAAAMRLPGLDNVRTLIFDETYYVKDAWSLLTLGYEGTWAKDVDAAFATGDVSGLSTVGGYPVHPPTGKWLIALGMKIFGQADPVGWRIAAAICGIITVFLLCRLTQNLFRTPSLTLLAGLFLATDGMAIVMSRTSVLDGFLTMFALAAFLCVVKDQEASRPRLLAKLREWDGLGAPRQGWPDLRAYLTRTDAPSQSARMRATAHGCSPRESSQASPPPSSGQASTPSPSSACLWPSAKSHAAGAPVTPPPSAAPSSPTSGGHSSSWFPQRS